MRKIKERVPATQYIFCLTEYLTQNSKNSLYLNCFQKRSEIVRMAFNWEYLLCGDEYNLFGKRPGFERALMRRFFSPFLVQLATFDKSDYGQELMLARRGTSLHRAKDLCSLCFSTTDAVLDSYGEVFDCDLAYLPTLIDLGRAIKNRNRSKKHPSIIFSGRLTKYRNDVMTKIGRKILNIYPLEGGSAWDEDALLADTKFKLSRLRREENELGAGAGDLYTAELEKTELAALEILHINLNQYVQNKEKTAAYEIYIPQRVGWPYSSPNRTLLSIESGFIPLDFGYFSDHALNQVALTVDDTDSITRLLAQDLEKNFIELDERIMSYNQAEKNSLEKFKGFLNPLL